MKTCLLRLKNNAYTSMGLYRLSEGFGSFVLVHTIFLVFTSLQGVFINTLFIRLTGNSDNVMLYNMIVNAFSGPMMLFSSWVARRTSPVYCMRIGIAFQISMYVIFFLSMDRLTATMPLIAFCAGTGNGFYWFSYSYIVNVYSTDESRDLAVSLIGIVAGTVSLVMPAVAGVVIAQFEGISGYAVMFAFSLAMAVVTILLTRRMRPIRPDDRRSHLRGLLGVLRRDRLYALMLLGEYFKCLREGVCGFLFNILLFQAITNEAVVGLNTLLAGLASIFGAWAYGRLVTSRTRIRSMFVSCSLLVAFALALFVRLSPVTIILYSTLNALLGVFLMNPTFSLSYALVLGEERTRAAMPEFIGLRECTISLGRISGIFFALLMPKSTLGSVAVILALTLAQYGMTLVFRLVSKGTARREERRRAGEGA